jgi:ABC-2 type transport system permease protein
MRKLIAIILKDTALRFTSPVEWLFFLILPIIFMLLIGGSTGAPADQRVGLYVVDEANSPLSAALIAELDKSTSVHAIVETRIKALEDFDARKVSAVLIVPANFAFDTLQANRAELELRLLPKNMNAVIAQQAVQAVLGRVSSSVDIANASVAQAEKITQFKDFNARQQFFNSSLLEAQKLAALAPVRVHETVAVTEDKVQYDPKLNSSAGQMLTWVFIPLIGLSAMFAYERQRGTLRRLLTTPTRKTTYLFGTILGQVLTALVQLTILILFSHYAMGVNWGNPLALALVLVAFTVCASALGTMLGTLIKSEGQANGLSIMIGMVMAMMGGCWYPIELFPQAVRTAAKVLPTTWAMQGVLDVALRGQVVSGITLEVLVLLGFTLVFYLTGVLRFKYE